MKSRLYIMLNRFRKRELPVQKRIAISILLSLGVVSFLPSSVSSGTADKAPAASPEPQPSKPSRLQAQTPDKEAPKTKPAPAGKEAEDEDDAEQLQLDGYRKAMEKSIRKRFGTGYGPIILLTLTDKGAVKATEFLARSGKPAVDEAARVACSSGKYAPLPAPWKVKEITFCVDLSR